MTTRSFSVELDGDDLALQSIDFHPPQGDQAGTIEANLNGRRVSGTFRILSPNRIQLLIDGQPMKVQLAEAAGIRYLAAGGAHAACQANRSQRMSGPKKVQGPEVCPPMPSVVVRVLVEAGQAVKAGEPVAVVSAMKMESTLTAPYDGIVDEVLAAEGDKVGPKDTLVRMRPREEDK